MNENDKGGMLLALTGRERRALYTLLEACLISPPAMSSEVKRRIAPTLEKLQAKLDR